MSVLCLASAGTGWLAVTAQALLLLVLVALSASFSGSEPVLFSLTRVQLQHCAASPHPLRRLVARVMRNPQKTLAIILLGNTAVNVALFANTYVLFERLEGPLGAWAKVLGAACGILLVTVCGEALPKTLGIGLADRLAPLSAMLVRGSSFVLGPIQGALDVLLIRPLTRVLFGSAAETPSRQHDLSAAELKALLEMSRQHGLINPVEDAFLREVINLGRLRVRDIMIPRVEVRTYDVNAPAAGLRDLMRREKLKKVPVYEKSIDNIVGLVYAKVVYFQPNRPLREMVVPVRYIPDVATGEQLLQHFRRTKSQLAIAVDEFGGMAGLVTLEDLVEAIVGDLSGPDETPEPAEIVEQPDGDFEISGRLSVHYWGETFGIPHAAEHAATVGGFVTARLGRPARAGDTVRIGNVELRVLSVRHRRIERLRLRLLEADDAARAAAASEAAS